MKLNVYLLIVATLLFLGWRVGHKANALVEAAHAEQATKLERLLQMEE